MMLADAGCSLGQPADLVATANLWARTLAPKLPPGALPALAEVWMFGEHAHHWPVPRDLMDLAAKCHDITAGAPVAVSPEEEWSHVMGVCQRVGMYQIGRAKGLIGEEIWRLIGEMSGYKRFCDTPFDELVSDRARFCAARKAQVARSTDERRLAPVLELLPGGGQITERRGQGFKAIGETLPARVGGGR